MNVFPNRTLALIKPDAVKRGLIGVITQEIELHDFAIHHIQMIHLDRTLARLFYGRQHEGRSYFEELVCFTISGPLVALILEHPDAPDETINRWRHLMGPADPSLRLNFQIRKRFCLPDRPLCENLVHGSDSHESYEHEIETLGLRHRQ